MKTATIGKVLHLDENQSIILSLFTCLSFFPSCCDKNKNKKPGKSNLREKGFLSSQFKVIAQSCRKAEAAGERSVSSHCPYSQKTENAGRHSLNCRHAVPFLLHAVQDPSQGMSPAIVDRICPINEQQSQQSSTDNTQRPISQATLDSAQLTILTIALCFQLTKPQKGPLPEGLRMFVPL